MATAILKKILDKLSTSDFNLTEKELEVFSDMDKKSLSIFSEGWKNVSIENKVQLLDELFELYLENTRVSFEAIGIALMNDEIAEVRANALQLIEETDNVAILPDLVRLLNSDPDESVREFAAQVAGNFINRFELDELEIPNVKIVEDGLLKAFHDEHAKVSRAALVALGASNRKEVIALVEQAFNKKDSDWQVAALKAGGRSADNRWAGQILIGINDADHEVRMAAIESAGELELKLARQPLLDMLDEVEDEQIFEAIIWSLSSIGGEDVRTTLEALIAETDEEEMIEFIEDALINLSFTEDLEQFDLLAVDPDDEEDLK